MGFGIKELAVVLIIVILLFGTKKLKSMGSDLGGAIKGFKKSMADDDADNSATNDIDSTAKPVDQQTAGPVASPEKNKESAE